MKKLIIILVIVFVILSSFIFCLVNRKEIFKIESRKKEIAAAKKKYKDYPVIGWIRVQNTNIDYFLVGKTDNDEYPVEQEGYGWISTDDNKYHNVLNIYGHNIMNLGNHPMKKDESFKRFEEVASFLYYDVAKKSKYIQLTMNDKDYIYEIFAVGVARNYIMYTFPVGEYDKDKKGYYLDMMKEYSIYDYDIETSIDDNYITLITCTRVFGSTNDSVYISAKLVSDKNLDDYDVQKNDNYKNINKVLSGDEDNEKEDV